MIINILTLFPQLLERYFNCSIMGRAVQRRIIDYRLIDIRAFATDRHRSCDDAPYGGGAGMVLGPAPLAAAFRSLGKERGHTIYPGPAGRPLDSNAARRLAAEERITFLCGHYEGVDQRILDTYIDEELSIGDYVLSSGEVAAMVIIESLFRFVGGVISDESLEDESFSNGLLEYPHYTRPADFDGQAVPPVLLSGHHAAIRRWRLAQSLRRTRQRRPDLLKNRNFSEEELELITELMHNDGLVEYDKE